MVKGAFDYIRLPSQFITHSVLSIFKLLTASKGMLFMYKEYRLHGRKHLPENMAHHLDMRLRDCKDQFGRHDQLYVNRSGFFKIY